MDDGIETSPVAGAAGEQPLAWKQGRSEAFRAAGHDRAEQFGAADVLDVPTTFDCLCGARFDGPSDRSRHLTDAALTEAAVTDDQVRQIVHELVERARFAGTWEDLVATAVDIAARH